MTELLVDGTPVATYVTSPDVDIRLAPRPYLHPVRTLGGILVTEEFPQDHPWHLGVSVTMQDVDGINIWGGRTYVRDEGYIWRDDHGRVISDGLTPLLGAPARDLAGRRSPVVGGSAGSGSPELDASGRGLADGRSPVVGGSPVPGASDRGLAGGRSPVPGGLAGSQTSEPGGVVGDRTAGPGGFADTRMPESGGFTDSLRWCDAAGRTLLREQRSVTAVPAPHGWELLFRYELSAPATSEVAIGSPATNGRTGGAGYGGFFWRATGGDAVAFTPSGAEPHGSTEPWVALTVADSYTLVFRGLTGDDRWFARTGDYNGVCAALAFETPLTIKPGTPLTREIRVLVADGPLTPDEIGPA